MEDGGDIDAARHVVDTARDAELFLYPGDGHLFTDSSLPAYDEAAAGLVTERALAFLADRRPPTAGRSGPVRDHHPDVACASCAVTSGASPRCSTSGR